MMRRSDDNAFGNKRLRRAPRELRLPPYDTFSRSPGHPRVRGPKPKKERFGT